MGHFQSSKIKLCGMTQNFVKPQWIYTNLIIPIQWSCKILLSAGRVFPHAGAETVPQSKKILKEWKKLFRRDVFWGFNVSSNCMYTTLICQFKKTLSAAYYICSRMCDLYVAPTDTHLQTHLKLETLPTTVGVKPKLIHCWDRIDMASCFVLQVSANRI